ncbi:hypothetical protein H8S90_23265 [Olivibacter sp. SDN3]|uniref:hypothetical protein n=1 Tax=Olivibacter sp. SDN3 TaxID=2764720 RepID=UPI001650ECA2|nr:hypothetical protein [Olivibacter sp. SDN3]QNL49607.1 hypothetical protein H8S90_23265 [Olivibacter sp. SDN3]
MKTLLIASLLGASILTVQAGEIKKIESSTIVSEAENEKEALDQKVEVQLYNLSMLKSQFKMAQENIKNSKGNHEEIEKDFDYFHSLLLENAKLDDNKEQTEKSIEKLKKEYARKHKSRATQELKELKALEDNMKKELNAYNRELASLRSKYKKATGDETSPALEKFEQEILAVENMLEDSSKKNVQHAAFYQNRFEKPKNI